MSQDGRGMMPANSLFYSFYSVFVAQPIIDPISQRCHLARA